MQSPTQPNAESSDSMQIIETTAQFEACTRNIHVMELTLSTKVQVQANSPSNFEYPQLLKEGRLVFSEFKLRPENHVLVNERIMAFRNFRSQMEQNGSFVKDIPAEFQNLIAVLVQDSDETLPTLANRLNDLLSPFERNEDVTNDTTDALERSIRLVARRVKYGLSSQVLNNVDGSPVSIPTHLLLHRWEALDLSCFPPDIQQVVHQRIQTRNEMSHHITEFFESLSHEQKLVMLSSKPRRLHTAEDVRKSIEEVEQEMEKKKKKEEEKKRREDEKRKRGDEKRKREEERKARDEERRKREVEKKQRDVERKKKEQAQLRLTSLFVKTVDDNKTLSSTTADAVLSAVFPPFFVKEYVTVSDVQVQNSKPSLEFVQLLDYYSSPNRILPETNANTIRQRYLDETRKRNPDAMLRRGFTQTVNLRVLLSGSDDISLELFNQQCLEKQIKMKLLLFAEDVRPAYYGTWTKSSKLISGRQPFAKDQSLIDYDHDSEAEWEPEGEGEDINSGDEDDDDGPPDSIDPEDNDWLVPEGYLSEDEGVDESEGGSEDSSRVESRPAVRPASRKSMAIRQVVIGPLFEDDNAMIDDDPLKPYEARFFIDIPTEGYDPFAMETNIVTEVNKTPGFTDERTNELISIIEGKADAIPKLVSEAKANWLLRDVSKRQIEAKIKDLAVKEKRGSDTKPAWYIKPENLQQQQQQAQQQQQQQQPQ